MYKYKYNEPVIGHLEIVLIYFLKVVGDEHLLEKRVIPNKNIIWKRKGQSVCFLEKNN